MLLVAIFILVQEIDGSDGMACTSGLVSTVTRRFHVRSYTAGSSFSESTACTSSGLVCLSVVHRTHTNFFLGLLPGSLSLHVSSFYLKIDPHTHTHTALPPDLQSCKIKVGGAWVQVSPPPSVPFRDPLLYSLSPRPVPRAYHL